MIKKYFKINEATLFPLTQYSLFGFFIIKQWQLHKLSKKHQEYFTGDISVIFAPLHTYKHHTITLAPDSTWRKRTGKKRGPLHFCGSSFFSVAYLSESSGNPDHEMVISGVICNFRTNHTHFHVAAC